MDPTNSIDCFFKTTHWIYTEYMGYPFDYSQLLGAHPENQKMCVCVCVRLFSGLQELA